MTQVKGFDEISEAEMMDMDGGGGKAEEVVTKVVKELVKVIPKMDNPTLQIPDTSSPPPSSSNTTGQTVRTGTSSYTYYSSSGS